MLSQLLAPALARRNIHYGWVMVAVTFLTALVSAGAGAAPGVFILPLQKEFGWTTAEISTAVSIRLMLFGLMAPFAAAILNRFGLRKVALVSISIVTASLLLSLGMSKIWQLILLWSGRRDGRDISCQRPCRLPGTLLRADRIAECDPAAGDLVHEKGIARVAEQQPLVAGKRRVGDRVVGHGDEGARPRQLRRAGDRRLRRAGRSRLSST